MTMSQPVVIAVAITGSVPRKKDTPAVPITAAEQIESTHEAFEAGAALVHIHVRDTDEASGSDPAMFAQVQEGVRKHCPGMIVQFSTGGRGREAERGRHAPPRARHGVARHGLGQLPDDIYENPPDFVDDLANDMLEHGHQAGDRDLRRRHALHRGRAREARLLRRRCTCSSCSASRALPARRSLLEFLVAELEAVLPGATWTAAGIARHQLEVTQWASSSAATAARASRTTSASTRSGSRRATPSSWRGWSTCATSTVGAPRPPRRRARSSGSPRLKRSLSPFPLHPSNTNKKELSVHRLTAFLLALAVSLAVPALAAPPKAKSKDNPKCQPNPVFEKFPGSYHDNCDRSRFMALEIEVAKDPAKLQGPRDSVKKEGEYWYYRDPIDKDASGALPSPLELQRNIENAVRSGGGTVLAAQITRGRSSTASRRAARSTGANTGAGPAIRSNAP